MNIKLFTTVVDAWPFESFLSLSLPLACPISFSLIQFSVSIYAFNVYSSITISMNLSRNFYQKKLDSCIIKNQSSIMFHFSKYESVLNLLIAEPVTEIAGGPDLFINKDSTINLTCLVRYAPEPPSTIVWSHDHEVSWIFLGKISESFSNFLFAYVF